MVLMRPKNYIYSRYFVEELMSKEPTSFTPARCPPNVVQYPSRTTLRHLGSGTKTSSLTVKKKQQVLTSNISD